MSRAASQNRRSVLRRALFMAAIGIVFFVALPNEALGANRDISGFVKNGSAVAISGVTMTLSGAASSTTTTDATGFYTFTQASGSNYTVTPSKINYTFNPVNRSYTPLPNNNQTNQDFTGGQTATWDGGAGTSNWGDANNWDTNAVPTASDTVNLTGANVININVAAAANNLTLNNAGLTLTITSANSLAVASSLTLTSGALNMGANTVSGVGSFTLSSGGNLSIGSTAGITSSGATGNVQVSGTRTFSTAGNYTYNGASAQVTGNGLPATVNKLTINNSAGVTLSATVAVSSDLTVTAGTLDLGSFTANRASAGGTLTVSSGATLKIGGTNGFPSNYSTNSLAATSTVEYNGTTQTVGAQNYGHLTLSTSGAKTFAATTTGLAGTFTISGTATANMTTNSPTVDYDGSGSQSILAQTYYNLTISNAGTKTLAGTTTVNNNLSVSNSAVLDLSTFTANRASAGGTLTLSSTATLRIGGTNTLPSSYSTHSIAAGTTVEYDGTTQSVAALNSAQDYGHLIISGLGTKTLAGTENVAGDLTISALNTFNLGANTIDRTSPGGTLTLAGLAALKIGGTNTFPANFSTHSIGAASTVEYSGANQSVAVLNSAQNYNGLTISGSGTKTLAGDVNVAGLLSLSSGTITTGANTLYSTSTGSVFRSSGHVIGNFKRRVATGSPTKTFDVGDASNYTPVTVVFSSVTTAGDLTVSVAANDHANIGTSNINASKSVNRNWTLTNSGIVFTTYDATFTFVAGDVDGGASTAAFGVGKYNAGWTYPTAANKLATSTQATLVGTVGDFEIGESGTAPGAISGTVFEDTNYGGVAGRSLASSSGTRVPSARVELFTAAGNYSTFATTDVNGNYSFANLPAATYTVRVVNGTVNSSRTGTEVLPPVQTYRTNASSGTAVAVTDHVGGEAPASVDAGNGSTTLAALTAGAITPQSITSVVVSASSITGVDFGYSYDVIVNKNDAGQGSLRQFMLNADALSNAGLVQSGLVSGKDNAVFMLADGTARAGLTASYATQFASGIASITLATALPTINNDPVILDASLQPGYAGLPMIELNGAAVAGAGFHILAGSSTVRGFIINSFTTTAGIGIVISTNGNNTITGNYIGTNAQGTAAAANAFEGIFVRTANNTIGGTTVGERNVISGNAVEGIQFDTAGATGNLVQGNYIGTDAAGTGAIANGTGVFLSGGATNNTIGGTTAAARNVISGNTGGFGVAFFEAATNGNFVQGNYIGVNSAGTAALANAWGVYISSGTNNTIGSTAAGGRNVISGNSNSGLGIDGSTGNSVLGNYFGTDAAGTVAIPNVSDGVYLLNGANNNTIGGTAAGARNVISGNTSSGMHIHGGSGNSVLGNYIGTDAAGTAAVINVLVDVHLSGGSNNNTIGGTSAAARNVILRLAIDGSAGSCTGNLVQGNYIGTNKDGTAALANTQTGVYLYNGANNNTIGGTTPGARNVISGNLHQGIAIHLSSGNFVQGNYIGIDAAGTAAIGNGLGINIFSTSTNNTIGGTVVEARNIISGNTNHGVGIDGVGNTGNLVQGNYIGTNATASAALANGSHGVYVFNGAASNTIGGTAADAGNLISGNAGKGVVIADGATNAILSNSIYGNTGIGIDLADDGVTANDGTKSGALANSGMDTPVFTTMSLSGTTLTVAGYVGSAASQATFAGASVEVFKSDVDSSGFGEGQTYLGTLTADGSGNFNGTVTVSLAVGDKITGTATDASNNSSEFGANATVTNSTKTWDGGAGTDNWGDAANWNADGVPVPTDNVNLTGANTININVAATANNLTLNNASLTLTINSGNSLAVSGALALTSGTLNMGTSTVSGAGSFTLGSGGNLGIGSTVGITSSGATGNVQVTGTRTFSSAGNYTYNGSGAQVTGSGLPATVNNLTIDNSADVTLSAGVAVSSNLTVTAGTLDLSSFTANRATSGGTLLVASGAKLKIRGTNTLPSNYSTHSIGATSTIEYGGTTQSVGVLNSAQNYGNLTISGSLTKTLAATISVAGDLAVSAGTFDLGSFTANRASAGGTLSVAGAATLKIGGTNTVPANYSTHSIDATSTIEYNGINQSLAVLNSGQDYGHLTISGSGTKTLAGSENVGGTLTLTSGTITTGASTLYIASTGTVSRTSGHVIGNFQKNVAIGATNKSFEVGDATYYTPIDLVFASVTTAGDLTANVVAGDHANIGTSTIDPSKSVNRNWTMINSGIVFTSYDATFSFVTGDVDAGASTSALIVGKYSGGSWTYPTVGTRTSTTTQATGVTAFSDFQIGELPTYTISGHIQNGSAVAISGVTVTLSGAQAGTTTTDASGNYSFPSLPAYNNYTVTPAKTYYTFSEASLTYNNLSANQTAADFTGALVPYYISGHIADGSSTPLSGITVTLSGGQTSTTTTDASGNYFFADLLSTNDYTVTPSKTNYGFSPVSRPYNNLTANHDDADFTGTDFSGHAPSLGAATSFAVLAATTVTNTGLTVVSGNLGVSPGTAVTGFGPGVIQNGAIYSGSGSLAGPAHASAATAYNDLVAQPCLPANNLSGKVLGVDTGAVTLGPGVYCFDTSAQLTTTLTLDDGGDPDAVFIFKIGTTLTTASDSQVIMSSGGRGTNVYWQIGTSATIGTGTSLRGNLIASTSITMTTGASTTGRLFAIGAAVTMDTNNVDAVTIASSPQISLFQSVTPSGTVAPGTDLVFSFVFTNIGNVSASSYIIVDPIPDHLDFKVGTATTDLGTTLLTVTVEYSDNDTATWNYTPVSGGGSASPNYDGSVTHVRWRFNGTLSPTSPNNTGSIGFTAKIH